MSFSIITVAKGMWDVTERMLNSLIATTKPGQVYKIIYNDNGTPPEEDSWKKSREWEETQPPNSSPRIQRYRYDIPISLSEIWNESVKGIIDWAGETDKILIVNNDVIFHKAGWLDEFDQALDEPGIGIVGLIGMSWKDTPFVQGSLLAFKRSTFNAVDGFDTRFPFTCEDVDFAKRVALLGLGMKSFEKFRDDGTIQHLEGSTRNYYKDSTKEYQRLAHISRLEFCYKWTYPDIHIHD